MNIENILNVYEQLSQVTNYQSEKNEIINRLPDSIKLLIENNDSESFKQHLCPNNFRKGSTYQIACNGIKVVRDYCLDTAK